MKQKPELLRKLTVEDKFKMLCPAWYKTIPKYKTGTYIKDYHVGGKILNITEDRTCIVGEFHGFNHNYDEHYGNKRMACKTCNALSCGGTKKCRSFCVAIEDVAGDVSKISKHKTFIEFIKHAEKTHPEKCPWIIIDD